MKHHPHGPVRGAGSREYPSMRQPWKWRCALSAEPKRWMKTNAPSRAAALLPGLCARRARSMARSRMRQPRLAAPHLRAGNSAAAWAPRGPTAVAATAATRDRPDARRSRPCAGCCTTGIRPGLGTKKQPGSRARTPRTKPWQSHGRGCRIRDSGEKLARHKPAARSRRTRPRAPAKSRSAPGRCDTTACVRDGDADSTGCRRAPVGLRQTSEHPRDRVDRMGEGIAVPQNATLGVLWRPNPPEQAGVTGRTRERADSAQPPHARGAASKSPKACSAIVRSP